MRLPECAALMLVVSALYGCGGALPEDDANGTSSALTSIVATLSARSGDVQVKRRGEGFWTEGHIATVLRPGDWVKTGPGAYARVELLSGGALDLAEGASLVLEEATDGGSDGNFTRVAVREGSVTAKLGAGDTNGLNLKLEDGSEANLTPSGDQPVEFKLSHGQNGTEIELSSGEAQVKSGTDSRVLKRGAIASMGQGRVSDLKLLPPGDPVLPSGEAVFGAGMDVGMVWSAVPGAKGYRVAFARDPLFGDEVVSFNSPDRRMRRSFQKPGVYYWRVASVDAGGHVGAYGKVARFFVVSGEPEDRLSLPDDDAVYGFVDSPPALQFRWRPMNGEDKYVLVIGWGPDLWNQRLSVRPVHGASTTVKGLTKGQYYWGVYRGEEVEPIFTSPRRFQIVKTARAVLKAPVRIDKWGK